MRTSRLIGSLLRTCIAELDAETRSERLEPLIASADLSELVDRAIYHGVANFVYVAMTPLEGLDLAAEPLAVLQRRHARSIASHMRTVADLDHVAAALDGADIPWLAFKGPILSETVYPRADLRDYVDMDLLVPPAAFRSAVEALDRSGAPLADRNWEAIKREARGQVHPVLPFGTPADLHWDLLINEETRRPFDIAVEELVSRRRLVQVNGRGIPTFHPTDALVHLCVHAGLAGGHRLIWLKDIERLIAAEPPAWDEVVTRASEWRARALVAAILQRSRSVAGTLVPDDVLTALAPRAVLASWRVADRGLPVERTTGHYAVAAMWTRSLTDDVPSSFAHSVAKVRSVGITGPQLRRALRRSRVGAYADELSPLRQSGDEETRADYLRQLGSREDSRGGPDKRR